MSIVADSQRVTRFPGQRVYVKTAGWLNSSWVEIPDLECQQIIAAAPPSISVARLEWAFGALRKYTSNKLERVEPLTRITGMSYAGLYCRVEIDRPDDENGDHQPPLRWYGIIVEDLRDYLGTEPPPLPPQGVSLDTGDESLIAWGLEVALMRDRIRTSFYNGPDFPNSAIELQRALEFNGGTGRDRSDARYRNNRSLELTPEGIYPFTHDLKQATAWNGATIADYLLTFHTPRDRNGNIDLPWQYATDATDVIEWQEPQQLLDGRTLFAMYSALADRRRLMGWCAEVDVEQDPDDPHLEPVSETPQIRFFSFTDQAVPLGGASIPANPLTTTIDLGDAVDVENLSTRESFVSLYQRVVVRGARRTACFSVSNTDGTLEPNWSSAQQTQYDAGGKADPDYDLLTEQERARRNRTVRSDPLLAKVYSSLRLPAVWDYRAADGEGGEKSTVSPELNPVTGEPTAGELNNWRPGLRLLDWIPLAEGSRYDQATLLTQPPDEDDPGTKSQRQRPFVVMPIEVEPVSSSAGLSSSSPGSDRWQRSDEPVDTGRLEKASDGPTWQLRVSVENDAPALRLTVAGAPQHAIAAGGPGDDGLGAELGGGAESLLELASIPWTTMIATVAIEIDAYATFTWPFDAQLPGGDQVNTLEVRLPDARQDYLLPQTVVGVVDGQLARNKFGGMVRDDHDLMERTARALFAWHGTPRNVLNLTRGRVEYDLQIGQLVTELIRFYDDEEDPVTVPINAAITVLEFNLLAGTTRLQTAYGDLDQTVFA